MAQLPTRALTSLQRRTEPDAILIDNGETTWKVFKKPWLGQIPLQHYHYLRSREVIRKAENDDSAISFRVGNAGHRKNPSLESAAQLRFDALALRSGHPAAAKPISRANST
jgi:hypothetical protein